MTQYLLSVHSVEGAAASSGEEMAAIQAAVGKVNAELRAAGAWVFAGGLHPPETATVVRASGTGEVMLTDGPFVEGKEHIGGVWVIERPISTLRLIGRRRPRSPVACRSR